MRKVIGTGLLLWVALPALAHDPDSHEREILQASELVPWCRQEAEARYTARGETTYQWSASYSDRGNTLSVEGRLRVEGRDVKVECRIARGARERHASISVADPKG
ncbi:hypothetical protein MNQ95_06360 [Pseudoxanthomonas daejeonensis]|uniref:hypothetical protein n=1 Tax=Pseudoxanthomonas daejeonensis TaxID=266062 RepID=UPI001F5472D4|nr:hypothetical protein [Pseudoxanthomonas daejeonensis]UNK58706.1 hypothetical protein MNQ95_06360 [Pseudoxanthomonas daejeonensis]